MRDRLRILVVDSNDSARKNHVRILKGIPGARIEETDTGGKALKRIQKQAPHIIVCDRELSDMDGLSFCNIIKDAPNSVMAGIYLILIGPREEGEDYLKFIDAGADDFLIRPVQPDDFRTRIKVGERITRLLSKTELESQKMFQEIDVLLIQEGGCAPGYNPVTAFITYHLEGNGRKVFATREGFKSLVSGKNNDFVRLVYDPDHFKKMDHIPGVFHAAPLSEWRGAQLRSERYRDFLQMEIQKKAASTIRKRKVRAMIAIGGNGTFRGIRSLCTMMPTSIQVFFIPVTIDSDVAGTECIGQHTGVEMGAERIRCFMADARTHKRTYIIEMMGANSGFHALHSCLGARAHLTVLPNSVIDHRKVAKALNQRDECVIVVAEGYKKEERDAAGIRGNAAEYFYQELLDTGIKIKRRVVCEPFSRDIRGAAPNNMDISLAQRMAYNVSSYLKAGTSRLMPAVESGREYAIPFNEIQTDNLKAKDLLVLSDRLTKA